ncbi:hypothetical protein [Mesorhizobium sp. M1B.F.Ca.ET.045.04.1.1]|uniref:hypothetical protein n=1 Tax=Mesorhizobium sp. M1B.F.Ca.ET.045.04.1.1 TaxID=2493673 RepID=UPI000F76120F|nr:hypothetical protein [Mesorhizobium sp. M1B.F.Ca.ET.045.04.1.1]AZO29790.1 hypothetical protein EJ071_21905 [Mesorhizobium sp. M1B.F.Ca.ET.045.04.1.1]
MNTAKTLAALLVSMNVLAGCGPSGGEVKKVDLSGEQLPGLSKKGAKVAISGLLNGADSKAAKAALEKQGDAATLTPVKLSVYGMNGGKVNALYATTDQFVSLQAKGQAPNNLGDVRDTNTGELSATFYGTYLLTASYTGIYSDKYNQGPTWKAVADQFISELGQTSYGYLPADLHGQNETSYAVPASAGFEPGHVNIKTQECHRPGATMLTEAMPSDMLYKNRVCKLEISYAPDDQPNIYMMLDPILKAKYVELFGKPDCWFNECDDATRQKVIDARIVEKFRDDNKWY